jgi:hypothetical protein
MREQLSASTTTFMIVVYPVALVVAFGGGAVGLVPVHGVTDPAPIMTTMLICSLCLWWYQCGRCLNLLIVDETTIYAYRFGRSVEVPLANVAEVHGGGFLAPVTIELQTPCALGRRLHFMPRPRMLTRRGDPEIKALQDRIAAAMGRAAA